MNIHRANTEELKKLIPIYKKAFPVHNVFTKSDEEIFKYMETADGDFLVAVEDEETLGGLLIAVELETPEHKRARFKHVAVAEGYQGKGIGSALLKQAEKIVGMGKIEIHVAEGISEPETEEFYKKNGYEIEGELKSHYRPGEICYIMGKVLE